MDLNRIEIDNTGLLFFDILNGYYHQASAAAKVRKKPMIDNAVLLMKAARQARIPIFFARGIIGRTRARPF
jgi:nicotinamidase-related amidase